MITSIEIENLRGIGSGRLDGLMPLTILTGPNACGKSTVLDALLAEANADDLEKMALFNLLLEAGKLSSGRRAGEEIAFARQTWPEARHLCARIGDMGTAVTISIDASGRLVVPEPIREQAGFKPGMALEIRYRGGRIEIEPASTVGEASPGQASREDDLRKFLEREIWPQIPRSVLGKPVSKQEREQILGYGPAGV